MSVDAVADHNCPIVFSPSFMYEVLISNRTWYDGNGDRFVTMDALMTVISSEFALQRGAPVQGGSGLDREVSHSGKICQFVDK